MRDIGGSAARSTSPASRASSSTRSRSSGRRGHRHDVGGCGRRAGLVLHRAHGAEGVQHAPRRVLHAARAAPPAGGAPAARARSAAPSRLRQPHLRRHVRQRRRVGVGVVAHVHHEAVEAVRAQADQERVERRAARLPRARRHQATRGRAAGRARTPPRPRTPRARAPGARRRARRPGDAWRPAAPDMKVSLSRTGSSALRRRLASHTSGSTARSRLQRLAQRRPGLRHLRGERQLLDQRLHLAPVAAQDHVAGAPRRRDA